MARPDLMVRVPYVCACSATYVAQRVVCLRGDSSEDLEGWVQKRGTLLGACPACGRAARGVLPLWGRAEGRLVAVVPAEVPLPLDLYDRLGEVLAAVEAGEDLEVDPRPRLLGIRGKGAHDRDAVTKGASGIEVGPGDEDGTGVPSAARPGSEEETEEPRGGDLVAEVREEGETVLADAGGLAEGETVVVDGSGPLHMEVSAALRAEIVAKSGEGLGAHMGDLRQFDGRARVVVRGASSEKWKAAELSFYPVHLRSWGYPLYGVRVVGKAAGQMGLIDAVVDPGEPVATEVGRALSRGVKLELVVLGGGEYRVELASPGFERNVVACLESAQARLARDRLPPSGFGRAVAALSRATVEERLEASRPPVLLSLDAPLATAADARRAMDGLDAASRPEVMAVLLEEAGLAYAEFEAHRRRVLEAATECGIVAPRRFWRRVTAAGIAPDLPTYVATVARNLAKTVAAGGGGLSDDEVVAAWQAIWTLCERKAIDPPSELRAALGIATETDAVPSGDTAAGIISAREDTHARWRRRLLDPADRVAAISEALSDPTVTDRTLSEIFDQLENLQVDELLAILPDLLPLGRRVVPNLVARLGSTRLEVRQASAITLGAIGGPEAIGALVDYMLEEPTKAWIDAARALGGHGGQALDVLARRIRRSKAKKDRDRLVRALAEIAVADGAVCARLERLARDATRGDVSRLARAALAQRSAVRREGEKVRGESPMTEVTRVRGFSRRAYEALFAPELDLEEATEVPN